MCKLHHAACPTSRIQRRVTFAAVRRKMCISNDVRRLASVAERDTLYQRHVRHAYKLEIVWFMCLFFIRNSRKKLLLMNLTSVLSNGKKTASCYCHELCITKQRLLMVYFVLERLKTSFSRNNQQIYVFVSNYQITNYRYL